MSILTIYRGLPGSGKTTLARESAAHYGGRLVGRDHLRPLLGITSGVGTPDQEAEVTKLQEKLILEGLRAGEDAHVDDMNLRSKYVRRLIQLAQRAGALTAVIDLTNVPLETCISRDFIRGASGRWVGSDVIRDLHSRYIEGQPHPLPLPEVEPQDDLSVVPYEPDPDKPRAVIVDIDGTVAHNNGHRGWYEYDKVFGDAPKEPVIRAVRAMWHAGHCPVFVSGRSEDCRAETERWLNKWVIAGPRLWMRASGDHRDDAIVKLELFNRHIRDEYNVTAVFDDRQRVVDMWRALGLTVFQVAPGDF